LARGAFVRYGARMPTLPQPDAGCALFLDFDGTLTEIAPTPDSVRLADGLLDSLGSLSASLGGALAVVTGRSVDDLDRHLHPLKLPASGVHGVELRGVDGALHRVGVADLDPARALVDALSRADPRLRLEVKPGALALHYRAAPEREADCLATMRDAQARVPGTALQRGKMVVELKPAGIDKGSAVRAFLAQPPFRDRRPWFVGDDVTDEAAFAAVIAAGGMAVKVGAGETVASHRLPDPLAVRRWLYEAARALA
jgi:trehalose 6-phosphate phosphatase